MAAPTSGTSTSLGPVEGMPPVADAVDEPSEPQKGVAMRKALVVLGAIVVVAAFAPVTAPDQPVTFPFAFSQTAPLVGACPFDITVDSIVSGRGTVLTYKSGARREQYHVNEQDRFSVNGKSLSGVPFTFNATWIFDSNGIPTSVVGSGVAVAGSATRQHGLPRRGSDGLLRSRHAVVHSDARPRRDRQPGGLLRGARTVR